MYVHLRTSPTRFRDRSVTTDRSPSLEPSHAFSNVTASSGLSAFSPHCPASFGFASIEAGDAGAAKSATVTDAAISSRPLSPGRRVLIDHAGSYFDGHIITVHSLVGDALAWYTVRQKGGPELEIESWHVMAHPHDVPLSHVSRPVSPRPAGRAPPTLPTQREACHPVGTGRALGLPLLGTVGSQLTL